MLTEDDRRAIEGLFQRLEAVEQRAAPRDADAEALIARQIDRQPGAAYYMAQTVLVQEQALSQAQQRIEELERQAERGASRGGFLGGLFDDNRQPERPARRAPNNRGPWDRDERQDNRAGGGFLAGAAQTALGVTGGLLLGSAIAGMFGVGEAQAAEPEPAQDQNQGQDQENGDAGGDFGGDDGGFDMGGDF